MSDLQANHDEFIELIREQENCEDIERLHQISLRMSELNQEYFGSPPTRTRLALVEVPVE